MREVLIALAGNQNSGKTTLFNRLTGSNQHVGNFPGVTVERKEGTIKSYKEATLVDLPGIYSLSPYTSEEVVTRDFILEGHPDVLINIVDATNIERNLYLSLQLLELEIPMVIALNMMDEVNASGNSIDVKKLSDKLGVPVVPISAGKNEGIFDLIDTLKKTVKEIKPKQSDDEILKMPQFDFCSGEVHRAIHAIAHIVEDHARRLQYPLRFTATKLVEGDELIEQALALHQDDRDIIDKIVQSMEQALGLDREAALADMRYTYIEQLVKECVVKRNETLAHVRSEKLDRLFTHKYLGIPVFIMIMLAVFYLTFGPIGGTLQALMEEGVGYGIDALSAFLVNVGVSDWLHALIIDGICNGVGSVVSFLPLIVVLFFFLSLLEDSGYMARVAFVMDKALRKIGLSGKSFVPMLIGFGCSVPAIMSARTLSSERDRKMTIIVTPFMSCSAKLPIYGMITAAFFPEHTALVLIAVYGLGILVAIVSALLLKRTVFQGEPIPFVLELPNYRIPDARSVVLHMWEKAKDFLVRAFTIIFVASILIWFLQSFDFTLHMVADSGESMLAQLGTWLSHIFAPLGFEDWRASTALVTGITAKESVVSTLSVLTNATSDAGLSAALMNIFTPVSAFAYLCFTVLYMPCVAAFAATKRELGSMKEAMFTALFQTGVAYIVALIVYQLGTLLFM
ncbi:ferrous iron transport protein B [Amedibacillus dolichus]|uniref:Ferrous iron transport protein B n=1 Tax=Amedibacillus dolichus DSM 3991 TaxID=428127 RepID=A8REF8_9FIRM|nr:ferrous iron transport protein B [Amedibacillus dolichus]EDP10531.1 ferrous iron transport protein B [Amedibacillus dolichus DSM 3991]